MTNLRELLKSQEPELYNALENSWKVANHDVFPILYSTDESLNSSPHSLNIENYLNSILLPFDDLFDEDSPVHLTPHELYCILMAILFHDSGRIVCEKGHGSFSKLYITKNYQKFFIPTEELADAIGDICDFHKSLNSTLDPVAITLDAGKGRIRIRELSELLILVDEMDTTYRRLKNLYILDQPKYYTGKALFRNYIKGVSYDHFTNAIIVSLDNKIEENTKLDADYDEVKYIDSNDESKEIITFNKKKNTNELLKFIKEYLHEIKLEFKIDEKNDERNDILQQIQKNKIRIEQRLKTENSNEADFIKKLTEEIIKEEKIAKKEINKNLENNKENEKNKFFVSLNKLSSNTDKMKLLYAYLCYDSKGSPRGLMNEIEEIASKKWPLFVVIPVVLNAIGECQKNTVKLKFIDRLGIHVDQWLISYKEHLFDVDGKEVCEPIFDYYYLTDIANIMWEMSNNTPLQNFFTFEELKSKKLEEDIKKLKLALQRIEIMTRKIAKKNKLPTAFSYDNRKWRWESRSILIDNVEEVLRKIRN